MRSDFIAYDKGYKIGVHCLFGTFEKKFLIQNFLTLNNDIKDSFKKFPLLFRQAEMVFVIVWFLDHFTLKYVPLMNSVWIIMPADLLHVWVTKFTTIFMFFKLSTLTLNNVIWVGLFAILFNEAQHFVKIFTTGYVPVYEVINFFIKPQKFLLMDLICGLQGLYLIIFFFDGLLMFFLYFACKLLQKMRK